MDRAGFQDGHKAVVELIFDWIRLVRKVMAKWIAKTWVFYAKHKKSFSWHS